MSITLFTYHVLIDKFPFFAYNIDNKFTQRLISMTNFLIRLFVKRKKTNAQACEEQAREDLAERGRYVSLAGFTGIIVNFLLFIGKLTVGLLASSVAIIADAFNNISDAGSSVVALIGFRLANKPVDKEHPLGHGRLEYVSGFIVDMLIILVDRAR